MLLSRMSSLLLSKQINKIQNCYHFRNNSQFYANKLTNKKLIRVSGRESFIYLQSLLSNDMRHLMDGEEVPQRSCVYTFMLSALAKVLCDLIIYRGKLLSYGELIVEVDSKLANALRRLLLGYNINRNISVEPVNDIHLWALIPKSFDSNFINSNDFILNEIISDDLQLVNDPRIPQMGYRLLTRIGGNKFNDIVKYIDSKHIEEGNLAHYQNYRFKLGVSEGYNDLLSGFYFPFECNGDYLNAISLDKGLYTSEEKAIKVYLKQPIVKRIMPIELMCSKSQLAKYCPPPRTQISSNTVKHVGFLRNRNGFNGIASLTLKTVLSDKYMIKECNHLHHTQTGLRMRTWKPEWWPQYTDKIYLPQVNYPLSLFNIIPQVSD